MAVGDFGRMPDGTPVRRISIQGGGLTAHVLTYGSVVQDLRLDGHAPPLVLGLGTLGHYLEHSRFFGATAGRCANRIRGATFELDGRRHQLDRNVDGTHHLHGGSASIGKRVWEIEGTTASSVMLAIALADGEMGYPGNMIVRLAYSLPGDGTLALAITAECDAPTVCNMAHHSYFNLDGGDTMLDHELTVAADHYLPMDGDLLPTGEIAPVADGPFDFRRPKSLRSVCAERTLDHNFCLAGARRALTHVATLGAPATEAGPGVSMDVLTTEPGLQVYDGGKLNVPVPGLDGRTMRAHAGLALEPQVWPNAINEPRFPRPVLRPGETYRQETRFRFHVPG